MESKELPTKSVLRRPVYQTYRDALNLLVRDAVQRIKTETKDATIAPPPKTKRTIKLAHEVGKLRKRIRDIERTLRTMNLGVEDDGDLRWTWEHRRRLESLPSERRQPRLEQIKRLHVRATIDTLDMAPRQARAYLDKLEKQLAKI